MLSQLLHYNKSDEEESEENDQSDTDEMEKEWTLSSNDPSPWAFDLNGLRSTHGTTMNSAFPFINLCNSHLFCMSICQSNKATMANEDITM